MLPGQTSTVSIVNESGAAIAVVTTPDPKLVAHDDYAFHDATLAAATTPIELLQFSRNPGITNGETFLFSTAFDLDGVRVVLEERLEGTLLGSHMAQQITAGLVASGFQETSDAFWSPPFTGASGATYAVGWALERDGFFDSITYTVARLTAGVRRIPPVMPQIHTVVMLMLENRSLDNVLGWLHSKSAPKVVYPAGSPLTFDGIPAGASNAYHHTVLSPSQNPLADPANGASGRTPCRAPDWDPHEPMPNVANQLYGGAWGGAPSPVPWSETPSMRGFAWDYAEFYLAPGEIMGAYDETVLPILYGLAEGFAVSDAWFSSAPTQTDPNRAFAMCGTSNGFETNDDFHAPLSSTPTIFNLLALADKSSGIYWVDDGGIVAGSPGGKPYTPYWFPLAERAPGITLAKVGSLTNPSSTPGTFASALAAGTLPHFSFLEPSWSGGFGEVVFQGTDYHPPAYVGPGEAQLNALYSALKSSPQWPNMLFIVTFDEHGGLYDHVPPPRAVPPAAGMRGRSGFGFDRLGVRVPTILVSPFAPEGMVFRAPAAAEGGPAFDHTSFVATLLKWAGIDPASAGMGDRVASAPTFEGVLTDTPRAASSFPVLTTPVGYADQGKPFGVVHATARDAHAAVLETPVHELGGKLDVRTFRRIIATSSSAEEAKQRLRAALAAPASKEPVP